MSAVYLRQLYTGVQNSKWQNRSNVDCAYSRDGLFLVVCFLCSRMGGTTGASVSWTYPEGIRAVAPKASVALRRIISINKINPVPPGFDSTVLVPRSTLDQDPLPFVEISYGTCVFRVSLAISDAPLHHLETSFGFWVLLGVWCWVVVVVVVRLSGCYRLLVLSSWCGWCR